MAKWVKATHESGKEIYVNLEDAISMAQVGQKTIVTWVGTDKVTLRDHPGLLLKAAGEHATAVTPVERKVVHE